MRKAGSFRLNEGVMLQFSPFIPFSFHILNSANPFLLSPPVESLFYIYLFYQNFLIHMPFFYFLHSLMHSLQNFLSNKHSLKAILSTIKHFQVGYLFPSLDLNIL